MGARPVGVKVVAALHVLSGGAGLWLALRGLQASNDGMDDSVIWVIGGLCQALVALWLGWGVWELKGWARRLALGVGGLATLGLTVGGILLLLKPDTYHALEEQLRTTMFSKASTPLGLLMLLAAASSALTVWYLSRTTIRPMFQAGAAGLATTDTLPMQQAADPQHPPAVSAPPVVKVTEPPMEAAYQEQTQSPAAPYLIVHNGPQAGRHFLLNDKRNTIGRDVKRASIKVDDPQASRQHAQFNFEQGHVFLYDLASTNGTYVNNRRVRKQKLTDGDIVRIGGTEFLFKQEHRTTPEGHNGQYG